MKVGGAPRPMALKTRANVASRIAVANGSGALESGLTLANSAIRTALAAGRVRMVAAADGKVATSTMDPNQIGFVTVPLAIMDVRIPASHELLNGIIQLSSFTGCIVSRIASIASLPKVKIPGVPSGPPWIWFEKSAITFTNALTPETASFVGAKFSKDRLRSSAEGSIYSVFTLVERVSAGIFTIEVPEGPSAVATINCVSKYFLKESPFITASVAFAPRFTFFPSTVVVP